MTRQRKKNSKEFKMETIRMYENDESPFLGAVQVHTLWTF